MTEHEPATERFYIFLFLSLVVFAGHKLFELNKQANVQTPNKSFKARHIRIFTA
jgi:hypothetical protein